MLDVVLARMTQLNVRLKPSKCLFGMRSVEFLGRIFDNGKHLSEKRVQGIQDIPIPTSVLAVRSFVGMVNYFCDFIPNFSSHLGSFTELMKKKIGENGFQSTENAISAFKVVKRVRRPRKLQIQGGRRKPCVFVSHTLSEQETR